MAETSAVAKHSCAACGAQAEWHPGRQVLACAFCGTETPLTIEAGTGAIVELDLVRALRELPDHERGWAAERRTVQCQSCRAVSVFDPERVGQNCDFCGSPKLVDYHEIKAPIRPGSVLPFSIAEADVRERIRRWYAGRWFAPNALTSRALVDRVHGIYIPYWTFDAHADCSWQAEAGHYYYTTEHYRDKDGRTKTRRVRHTRWVPASGRITHFFDDEPVPGTRGIPHELLRRIEPFPFAELAPYDTAYLSGFVVEHYQVVLVEAAEASRASMRRQLEAMCAASVPGDTHRNLRTQPAFSGQTFKHILVPVWVLAYVYGGRAYQVLVNGRTGMMAGQYPKSPWKIALLVLAILIAVIVVIMVAAQS
jgi:hypothetical protein